MCPEFPENVNAEHPHEYAYQLALKLRVRRVSRALRHPKFVPDVYPK